MNKLDIFKFPLKREPSHPGEILKYEFLDEMGINQVKLSKDLNVSFQSVNEVINGKRGISPEMALKLARYFNVSVESWMNLQNKYDLYKVLKNEEKRKKIENIKPIMV
jgi:addiction module HigA family antidote